MTTTCFTCHAARLLYVACAVSENASENTMQALQVQVRIALCMSFGDFICGLWPMSGELHARMRCRQCRRLVFGPSVLWRLGKQFKLNI